MADQNEMSLIMRIRTLFEGKGTKEAVDNVAAVGKSAEDMGKKTVSAAGSSEKAFAAVNAATQVTEGGVIGVASAVKNLAGQFPKLQSALGPIGMLIAAFAAWKKAYDDLKNLQASVAAALRDTKIGNHEGEVRRLTEAYVEYGRALATAEDNRKRLSDAESSKEDAKLAADLAKLELAHAEAAAKLNPSDQFGRRRLDIDTASKRSALTDASALRKSDRELNDIMSEGRSLQQQKNEADQLVRDLSAEFASAQSDLTDIIQKIKEKSDAALTPAGKQSVYNSEFAKSAPDIARLVDILKAIPTQIKEAMATSGEAGRKIYSLSERAEVNRLNRDTQVTASKTGGVSRQIDSRQLAYDAAQERERIERELRDKKDAIREQEQRQSEMAAKTFKEYGDIRTAREKPLDLHGKQTEASYLQAKDSHDKNVAKELEEWKGLAKALRENAEKKTKAVADLRRDIERLNEALNNNPSQAN